MKQRSTTVQEIIKEAKRGRMFILVDNEIIEIINKPITKDVYAINEIIFLFFTRFTIEWNLNSSIPVSASNKSLVRFSQINIKIAAKVNAIKL